MPHTLSSVNTEPKVGQHSYPETGENTGSDGDLFAALFAQMGMQYVSTEPSSSALVGTENAFDLGQGLPEQGGNLPSDLSIHSSGEAARPLSNFNFQSVISENSGNLPPAKASEQFAQLEGKRGEATDIVRQLLRPDANADAVSQQLKNLFSNDDSFDIPADRLEALVGRVKQNLTQTAVPGYLSSEQRLAIPSQRIDQLEPHRQSLQAEINNDSFARLPPMQSALLAGERNTQSLREAINSTAASVMTSGIDPSSFNPQQLRSHLIPESRVRLDIAASMGDENRESPLNSTSLTLGGGQINSLHELLTERRAMMDNRISAMNTAGLVADADQLASPVSAQSVAAAGAVDGRLAQVSALGKSVDGDRFDGASLNEINLVEFQQQEAGDGDELFVPTQWKMGLPDDPNGFTDAMRNRVNLMMGNGIQRAQISLNPEELGQIDLQVELQDGELKLNLAAENPQVRDLIESSLPRLREMLENKGFSLGDAEVASTQPEFQTPSQGQSSNHFEQENRSADESLNANDETNSRDRPELDPRSADTPSGRLSTYA